MSDPIDEVLRLKLRIQYLERVLDYESLNLQDIVAGWCGPNVQENPMKHVAQIARRMRKAL